MNYKILIVDDQPDNLEAIVRFLEEDNLPYDILQALSGEVALKIAKIELPNLIITDWEMPEMDGIQLIMELHLIPELAQVPIIMCTGAMTSSQNLKMALEAGAVDYIRKPVDPIELVSRIKSMLELSDSRKKIYDRYVEIERKNKFIESLIESIPHPFVYYGLEGEILGCNKRFEHLLGIANNIIVKSKMHDFFDDSSIDKHLKRDYILKDKKDDISYESHFKGRDFIFSKTLFYNARMEPEGIMCVLTDVSELKGTHLELVESKKRELTANALRLIQISELNNNLVSDFAKINAYTNKKGSELLRQTITKFNLNSGDNFWQEFETHFANVYESFYDKLNRVCSDLTPGDKKLCAMLRLNLSSKDISTITFQNPKSIDVARYRLRKKLNLKSEENLIDFLMNIS